MKLCLFSDKTDAPGSKDFEKDWLQMIAEALFRSALL